MNREELEAAAAWLEGRPPAEVLRWAIETFGRRLALASSFGAEDVVLIDMVASIDPGARVFTIDTGRLPYETYELIDRIRDRYGISIEVYFPRADGVEAMVREHGVNLFYHSVELRRLCCHVRKVEPLERALATVDAWVTGLRREQAPTRARVREVEADAAHPGKVKVNPLAAWTRQDVWAYIRRHGVPYNPLHDRGYPSIGCAPCTRAVEPGEEDRAGRWWWEHGAHKECGLHLAPQPASGGDSDGRA